MFYKVLTLFFTLSLITENCRCNDIKYSEKSTPHNSEGEFDTKTTSVKNGGSKGDWDQIVLDADLFQCPNVNLEDVIFNMEKRLKDKSGQVVCISSQEFACTMLTLLNLSPELYDYISTLEKKLKATQDEVKFLSQATSLNSDRLTLVENSVEESLLNENQEILKLQKQVESITTEQIQKPELPFFADTHLIPDRNQRYQNSNDEISAFESTLTDLKNKGQLCNQIYTELKTNVQDLNSSVVKTEIEFSKQINQISHKIDSIKNYSQWDSTLQDETKDENNRILEKSIVPFYEFETDTKHSDYCPNILKIEELFMQVNQVRSDILSQVNEKVKSTDENTIHLKVTIENQLKRLLLIESDLNLKLKQENSRALKAESEILEKFESKAQEKVNSKLSLETEINRAIFAESNLHTLFTEQSEKFTNLERNLIRRLEEEIQRAKTNEDQLSSTLSAEMVRAKAVESELSQMFNANISKLQSDVINELNRAQLVEEALYHKISDEMSRAINSEAHLRASVNDEMRRALDKEEELDNVIFNEIERFSKIQKEIRADLQVQITRALSIEDELDGRFSNYEKKLAEVQEDLESVVLNKTKAFKNIESSLKSQLEIEINRAKETEGRMVSTIKAGGNRAKDFENTLTAMLKNEIRRAQDVEGLMRKNLEQNYTRLDHRYDGFLKLLKSEVTKVEDLSKFILRNSTHHMLVKAQELSQRYKKFHLYASRRFDKVEEDMKRHCTSGWFRSDENSEHDESSGVFHHVFGMFGRGRGNRNSDSKGYTEVESHIKPLNESAKDNQTAKDNAPLILRSAVELFDTALKNDTHVVL